MRGITSQPNIAGHPTETQSQLRPARGRFRRRCDLGDPRGSGIDRIYDERGIEELRSGRGAAAIKLAAYHPMGTTRMGRDPSSSVVDGDHEVHDVPGLYVCDASVFPSCLGGRL